MKEWNATHYLRYGDERTRPAHDLVTRLQLESPRRIVDLGCGPGNSTQLLHARWPGAAVIGVDNSPEMLTMARENHPDLTWVQADIANWEPDSPVDLVFSNAALQWLPNHTSLLPRLFDRVASGGALAVQIPSSTYADVRRLMHAISEEPRWNERMEPARNALTMESPGVYYDALVGQAASLDIWETEYNHVMASTDAIVDWIASTGLRPFVGALENEDERSDFVEMLRQRVAVTYEKRADGKTLFPFRRTFVIAYR